MDVIYSDPLPVASRGCWPGKESLWTNANLSSQSESEVGKKSVSAQNSRFRDGNFVSEGVCDRGLRASVTGLRQREAPALRPHEQPDHPGHDEG